MAAIALLPHDTIPVIVDQLGRGWGPCVVTYFCIEGEGGRTKWTLILGQRKIRFLLLGLSGVIYGAVDPDAEPPENVLPFVDSVLIRETFELIENTSGLTISIAQLWLPTAYLLAAHPEAQRDDVFRLHQDTFLDAHATTVRGMDKHAFHSWERRLLSPQAGLTLEYSPDETRAFREWCSETIDEAMKAYASLMHRGESLPRRSGKRHKPF